MTVLLAECPSSRIKTKIQRKFMSAKELVARNVVPCFRRQTVAGNAGRNLMFQSNHRENYMSKLRAVWRGEVSLPRTYWFYGFFLNGIVIGAVVLAAIMSRNFFLGTVFIALNLFTSIYVVVSIWRSSNNYQGPKVWAVLAKVACVVGMIQNVVTIVEWFGKSSLF